MACADDASGLLDEVKKVTAALERLPLKQTRLIRLPVFATEICGDPHAFDVAQLAGRLLERAIAALHPDPGDLLDGVFSATLRRDLLLAWAGLQRDDLLNRPCGQSQQSHAQELESGECAVALPLREVERLGRIVSEPDTSVVENPLFLAACEVERQLPHADDQHWYADGQPSMAIHYWISYQTRAHLTGGDFDGAGIGITSNLMRRYGALTPWRMSATDYRNATTRHAPCPSLTHVISRARPATRPARLTGLLQRGVRNTKKHRRSFAQTLPLALRANLMHLKPALTLWITDKLCVTLSW